MKKAPFIVLEGIDGSGKSTHRNTVVDLLKQAGYSVVVTREPGGTPVAEKLRGILKEEALKSNTQVLVAFAARNEHLNSLILPNLAQGNAIVCDRFTESSYAYQGADGADLSLIQTLEDHVQKGFKPDAILYFDVPLEVAAKRRIGRDSAGQEISDQFDNRGEAYFAKVEQNYKDRMANQNNYIIINNNQSIQKVSEELKEKINNFLTQFQNKKKLKI